MGDLYIALLHFPVLDKNGQTVTTAVTNIDVHDIARSARTYGVRRFFVVTPVPALQALTRRILDHWQTGFGSTYNQNRKEALALVAVEPDLDAVVVAVERESERRPVLVATSAREEAGALEFAELRGRLNRDECPYLLLLGTGWGLAPPLMERADVRLRPIVGAADYNHLSVRAAVAVMLDRLQPGR